MPSSSRPKPRTVEAMLRLFCVPTKSEAKNEAAMISGPMRVIPGKATSCVRKVEPSSAPRVTARLCWKLIKPAPTSTASSTVVADEDWLRIVTPSPVR